MTSPDNRQSGQIPIDVVNGLKSAELPMKGKLALITGSGRELGADTAIYLAGLGAQIIGNYREERGQGGKKKRDTEAVKAELGDKITFVQGDISQPDTTQRLTDEILKTGQKLDYLILNASGPNRDTNVIGNGALVDANLSAMNDGGVVVLLQSVPGHLDRQLSGLDRMPEDYIDVAPAKREGEELVRAKVDAYRAENPERDIRLLVVCPPEIPDTQNVRMFDYHSRNDPRGNATQQHQAIANQLGLPIGIWNKKEVAKKIGDLLISGDFKNGYTELFSDVEDAQTSLEKWYGTPDAVYVQTIEKKYDEKDNSVGGIGRSIVSKDQAEGTHDPKMLQGLFQEDEGSYGGFLTVTPEHARGHLNTKNGLPLIFPGHNQIRAAIESVGAIERVFGNAVSVRLKGLDAASFRSSVPADGVELHIQVEVLMRTEYGANYNVKIVNEKGDPTVTIDNLEVQFMDEERPAITLLENKILEGAAQTLAVSTVDTDGDKMPLFLSMRNVRFSDAMVKAGAGLEYIAAGKANIRGSLTGSVQVYSHGEELATIGSLRGALVDKNLLAKAT